MPKPPGSIKYHKLLKKLKPYGIIEMRKSRGKGSERIFLRPEKPGSTKGDQYPITYHGKGTEIGKGTIYAVLRRFGIDPKEFW